MTEPRAKRQHYVPRFYLQHFADADGLVWTYDILEDRIAGSTPENTAVQTNFYSPVDDYGNHFDELEKLLAAIESSAAPIYPSLIDGEVFAGQAKSDMSLFFSTLYLRSPAIINASAELVGYVAQQLTKASLSDRTQFSATMDKIDRERGETTSAEMRREIFEFMNDKSRYRMAVDRKVGLMAMLSALVIYQRFLIG